MGLPQGTTAHFGFLRQMQHFDVDVSTMEIVDMAPADGAAAFAQGGAGHGVRLGRGALQRMKEHGNVLLTGAEKEDARDPRVRRDVCDRPASSPRTRIVVAKFLEGDRRCERRLVRRGRGDHAAGDREGRGHGRSGDGDVPRDRAIPRSVEEQLTDKWLGGTVQAYLKGVADVFVAAGRHRCSAADLRERRQRGAVCTAVAGM